MRLKRVQERIERSMRCNALLGVLGKMTGHHLAGALMQVDDESGRVWLRTPDGRREPLKGDGYGDIPGVATGQQALLLWFLRDFVRQGEPFKTNVFTEWDWKPGEWDHLARVTWELGLTWPWCAPTWAEDCSDMSEHAERFPLGVVLRKYPCCRFHEHGGRPDWACSDQTYPEFLEWCKVAAPA